MWGSTCIPSHAVRRMRGDMQKTPYCSTPHRSNHINSIAFMVILTPSLDTEKNRCENGETRVYDKPDYRTLNQGHIWHQNEGQIRP
jgi:hypothetical protein